MESSSIILKQFDKNYVYGLACVIDIYISSFPAKRCETIRIASFLR